MNRLLTILLLAAATAHGQIDNPPTSVNIVDATAVGRAVLTAASTNAARTALGASIVGANIFTVPIQYQELYLRINADNTVSSLSPAAVRTNLGLGTTNNVEFRRLRMIAANATDNGDDSTLWLDTSGTNSFAALRLSGTGGGAEKYNAYLQGGSSGLTVSAVNGFRVLSGPTAGVGSVLFSVNSSGNATLNGVGNTAPSQTADSASSLMTRNLYDERLPLAFGLADQAQADFGTVTLANGASGSKAAGGFELTTGSSNNATAVWNASSSATFGRKHTAGIGGVSTVWTGRVMVGWWFVRALSTNSEIRLQYGRTYNATTHAALSARGVGVRIATNSVFFETHNGTTGFETTNAVTATNPMLYWAIVEAGVAKFYAGTTLVATVTNSVPTNNSTDNDFGWVMSMSNTSTNSSMMRAFANPGFVMQQ
jgi:hypothetical protein